MKNALLVSFILVLVACITAFSYAGTPYGTKTQATTVASNVIPSNDVYRVSLLNMGTTDVSVAVNIGKTAFDLAFTNNSLVVLCPSNAATVLENNYGAPGSYQFKVITNIMIRAESGTQTVYISAY